MIQPSIVTYIVKLIKLITNHLCFEFLNHRFFYLEYPLMYLNPSVYWVHLACDQRNELIDCALVVLILKKKLSEIFMTKRVLWILDKTKFLLNKCSYWWRSLTVYAYSYQKRINILWLFHFLSVIFSMHSFSEKWQSAEFILFM